MTRFKALFGKKPPPRVLDFEAFAGTAYVIGDIHGCLDLLKGLEARIVEDAKGQGAESLLVYIGDMIDRGPDSFGVLAHAMSPPPMGFRRICLMGNHEEMMLTFLSAPKANATWLDHGGRETLMSYGALAGEISAARGDPRKMNFLIERIVPQAHVDFLGGLAHAILLKDVMVSHTGGTLAKPVERQSVRDFIWGVGVPVRAVSKIKRDIVHGHFMVEKASVLSGIISIDTGAYQSGVLTAVKLGPEKTIEFISFSRQ